MQQSFNRDGLPGPAAWASTGLIVIAALFALTACGGGGGGSAPQGSPPPPGAPAAPTPPATPNGTSALVAPTISSQPHDKSVTAGQSTNFTIQAQGSQPLSYQWQRNGVDIAGATAARLDLASVATQDDGARYRVVVRNAAGQAVSNDAMLRVSAPAIAVINILQSAVVAPGQSISVSAGISGTPPFTYRWLRNGQPVSGAAGTTENPLLTFSTPVLTTADDGVRYSVVLETAQGSQRSPELVISVIGPARVSGGASHSLARSAGRTVWAWGNNSHGQLGSGTTTASATPVVIAGLAGVIAIAAGDNHSLALKEDGTVWAWGSNSTGALGDGTQIDRSTPQRVGTLSDVIAIAAGGGRSFALRAEGSLWGWGENSTGAVGVGTRNVVLEPAAVGAGVAGFRSIVAVATGANHTLALRADGRVFAFGEVAVPLEDGVQAQVSPVMVEGLNSIAGLAAGNGFSVALDINGRLHSWGLNGSGQLGLGSNIPAARPAPVTGSGSGMLPSTALAAGDDFVLVRAASGPFLAWGAGANGQLGAGDATGNTQSPVPVLAFQSPLVSIAAGRAHSLAVLADGRVLAWGANLAGQLGIGSGDVMRTAPVQIPALNLN